MKGCRYDIYYCKQGEPLDLLLEGSPSKAAYHIRDVYRRTMSEGEAVIKKKRCIIPADSIPQAPGPYNLSLRFEMPDDQVLNVLSTLQVVHDL